MVQEHTLDQLGEYNNKMPSLDPLAQHSLVVHYIETVLSIR